MSSRKQPKAHLPGAFACEARQVWLAFRDQPDSRRFALIEGMKRGSPAPCDPTLHADQTGDAA